MSVIIKNELIDKICVQNICDQLPENIKDMVYIEPCIYDGDVLLNIKPYTAIINNFDNKVTDLYIELIKRSKTLKFNTYEEILSNDLLRYFSGSAISVFNAHFSFVIDLVLQKIINNPKYINYFVYLNKQVKTKQQIKTLSNYCTIMNSFDVRFMFQSYFDERFEYDKLFSNFIIDVTDSCNVNKDKEIFIKNF